MSKSIKYQLVNLLEFLVELVTTGVSMIKEITLYSYKQWISGINDYYIVNVATYKGEFMIKLPDELPDKYVTALSLTEVEQKFTDYMRDYNA